MDLPTIFYVGAACVAAFGVGYWIGSVTRQSVRDLSGVVLDLKAKCARLERASQQARRDVVTGRFAKQ